MPLALLAQASSLLLHPAKHSQRFAPLFASRTHSSSAWPTCLAVTCSIRTPDRLPAGLAHPAVVVSLQVSKATNQRILSAEKSPLWPAYHVDDAKQSVMVDGQHARSVRRAKVHATMT
jgi:hypothetical protein